MNEKCTTDQDNGTAERHREQPVQQRMSAMLMTLFTARKEANHILQTMRLQHLRLCTAVNIRKPVNDGPNEAASDRSLVWLQQTVVYDVVDEWVDEQKYKFLGLDTSLRIC